MQSHVIVFLCVLVAVSSFGERCIYLHICLFTYTILFVVSHSPFARRMRLNVAKTIPKKVLINQVITISLFHCNCCPGGVGSSA